MARKRNSEIQKRAEKGLGSIRQRQVKRKDGKSYTRYELRYTLGKDENGNEQRRSESFKTKDEAKKRQDKVAKILKTAKLLHWSQAELETALHLDKCNGALIEASVIEQNDAVQTEKAVTLDEWFEKWVSSYGQNWAESTKRKYRDDYYRYISRHIGNKAINKIVPIDILEMIRNWRDPKVPPQRKALAPKYIMDLHSMLKSCFSAAQQNMEGVSNPCAIQGLKTALKKEHKNDQEGKKQQYSLEQAQKIITVISSGLHSNFYLFSAFFGLRVMENLGLTINDIDMDNHVIDLRLQLRSNFDEVPRKGETKHYKFLKDNDPRKLYFDDEIKKILEQQIKHERLKKQRLGDKWPSAELERGDLLFSNENGYYLSSSTVRNYFYRHVKLIDPGIRLHDLRHIYVMIADLSGVPMDLASEHLGHASSDFTKRVYLPDAPQEMQRKSAQKIGNTISKLRSGEELRPDTFFGNKYVDK